MPAKTLQDLQTEIEAMRRQSAELERRAAASARARRREVLIRAMKAAGADPRKLEILTSHADAQDLIDEEDGVVRIAVPTSWGGVERVALDEAGARAWLATSEGEFFRAAAPPKRGRAGATTVNAEDVLAGALRNDGGGLDWSALKGRVNLGALDGAADDEGADLARAAMGSQSAEAILAGAWQR